MRRGLIVFFVFISLFFGLSLTVGIPYNEFDNGLKNGLVSYYKFDETSGTTAIDIHGSNDGTTSGATVNQTGKIKKAYSFDGVDDYVDTGTILPINNVSVSFWMKTDTRTGSATLLGNSVSGSGSADGIQAYFLNTTHLQFARRDIAGATINLPVTDDSNWYHIILVASTEGLFGYVDGSLGDSCVTTECKSEFNNGVAFTQGLVFGGFYYNSGLVNDFDGKIDEIGIWNRSLSDSEILEIYNLSSDIEILEIIPIQVIKDVDLVLGKTTLVRAVLKNPSNLISKDVNVSLYFDGIYQKSNITETIGPESISNIDLWFVPGSAGIGKQIKIEVEEI